MTAASWEPVPPARGSAVPGPAEDAGLLERDRELASVERALSEAREGRGSMVLIEGPAGIGKSQLLMAARNRAAAAGGRVLSARASELERDFPYGVVRQLFEVVVSSPEHRASALTGAASTAATVFESFEASAGDARTDASFAALHGLYWLTVNLAVDAPLLLAVDDLHWCDRSSLRFVAYLSRRLEGLPVLLVATLRGVERRADSALLAEIVNDPAAVPVRPEPLSARAVAALVKHYVGPETDPGFRRACHTATGGNPLLLRELLRAVKAEGVAPRAADADVVRGVGPRAVSRAVLVRLARLPAEAVSVARSAAVLGEGADLRTLARVADMDEGEVGHAIHALVQAEVLRQEPPLAFTHPLVREAIYHELGPAQRELRHELTARRLAEAAASPERVATHLLATSPLGEKWIVDTLREAARAAVRKGAAESAVAYLDRALREPPPAQDRPEVLYELGLAEELTKGPAAARHLREAHDAAVHPARRGTLALLLARTLYFTGRGDEAAAVADRAIAELGSDHRDLQQRIEALRLNAALFLSDKDPGALARLAAFRRAPSDPGPGAKMLASIGAAGWMLSGEGSAEQCAELARTALAGGTLVEIDNGGGPLFNAIITLALADRDEALEACDASLAHAHRRGSLFAVSAAHIFRGAVLYLRGDLREARELLTAGFEELQSWGIEAGRVYPSAYLADVLIEAGDPDGAQRALERAGEPPETVQLGWWLLSRVRLRLEERRLDEALEGVEDCARRFGAVARSPAWLPWRSLRAEVLDRLGRAGEAAAIAAEEVDLARAWGAPRALGRALRVLGTIERDAGVTNLEEAMAVLEGSSARLERAKTLVALGTALRHARQPARARAPLRRGLELALACGAEALAERARSEVYATGARPRTDALSGPEALTPSERRVADLAAGDKTNRDIAQELFVTPRTVEVHLSNTYRKLGIHSRRELAGVLRTAL